MESNPTFAFVTIGSGSYLGSTVRDLTLANSLHKRGFKVIIYWMLENNAALVAEGVEQRMLCYGTRYQFKRPSQLLDRLLGPMLFALPRRVRTAVTQNIPGFVDRLLSHLVQSLFSQNDPDPGLARRLARFVKADGVSHLMMSFGTLGPLALSAKRFSHPGLDYLLTFQGDEEFHAYAEKLGLDANFRWRLEEALRNSSWPAIAISNDYRDRLVREFGLDRHCFEVIYNGVHQPENVGEPPFSTLRNIFPEIREDRPIVTYIGRQESEKGIDLLLYAAKMLALRNVDFQLIVCGSTAKGRAYQRILDELAAHLDIVIHHAGAISTDVRETLYAHSRCVVYPSINREPFGLVAVEAMSHGTPVLVPDQGGISEVIRQGSIVGGLTFRTWDSADLAAQLERLLTDNVLYAKLAGEAKIVAAQFSSVQMTNDILAHLGLSPGKDSQHTIRKVA